MKEKHMLSYVCFAINGILEDYLRSWMCNNTNIICFYRYGNLKLQVSKMRNMQLQRMISTKDCGLAFYRNM